MMEKTPRPKNKYRRGYPIFSFNDLLWLHLEKGRYVYLGDRVVHPAFILNMSVLTVKGKLKSGQISEAVNAQEEYFEKRSRA